MNIAIIGPAKGKPQFIGLCRSPEEQVSVLQRKILTPLVAHFSSRELDKGWDRLVEWLVIRQLRGRDAQEAGWFNVSPAEAKTAVLTALRAIEDKSTPPVPDYGALMRYIRVQVFQATQEMIGRIAGVSASKISRWESGDFPPDQYEFHRIRTWAIKNGLPWDDRWVHEIPEDALGAAAASAA